MTDSDRRTFAEGLYALGETFNEPVSPVRAEAYFDALKDLDVAAVLAAVRRTIAESRFFPRPAELREMVEGRIEDRADLAWTAIVRLVRRYGYPGVDGRGTAPDFPDEASRRAALELYGGWGSLCEKLPGEGPELLGTAKLFRSLYGSYYRSGDRLEALPSSREQARAVLGSIKGELAKRGLPTGSL